MPNIEDVVILVVEDDPGHARLIEMNLRRAGIANEIRWLEDGQKVLDFLLEEERQAASGPTRPLLLLLDLNMPVVDGYQVLEWMRGREQTRHLPVVILTTTDDEREVERCYTMGCNVYLTKPVDYERFSEAVRRLGLLLCVIKVPTGVAKVAVAS
jgi:CheY-like chemotaxis protein